MTQRRRLSYSVLSGFGKDFKLAQGDVTLFTDNDVVIYRDTHDVSHFDQLLSDLDILRRGGGISTGMVVGQNHTCRFVPDGGVEVMKAAVVGVGKTLEEAIVDWSNAFSTMIARPKDS